MISRMELSLCPHRKIYEMRGSGSKSSKTSPESMDDVSYEPYEFKEMKEALPNVPQDLVNIMTDYTDTYYNEINDLLKEEPKQFRNFINKYRNEFEEISKNNRSLQKQKDLFNQMLFMFIHHRERRSKGDMYLLLRHFIDDEDNINDEDYNIIWNLITKLFTEYYP